MTKLVVKGPPGTPFKVMPLRPAEEGETKPHAVGKIGADGRAEVTLPAGGGRVAVLADGFGTQPVEIPSTGTVEHTLER